MSKFADLGLKEPINKALVDLGYETPTVIQEKAIPQILSSNEDLKAFAQTGTGKTAAFSLPIVELADDQDNTTQAIILSPTRELAVQIGQTAKQLSHFLKLKVLPITNAESSKNIKSKLDEGVDVVVINFQQKIFASLGGHVCHPSVWC